MDWVCGAHQLAGMMSARKPYPSDISDDEWALVTPYLTLLAEDAGQRQHPPGEVFNGLCYIVKTGAPWRWMPSDLPPWAAVCQQAQRWPDAGCFEELVHDLRAVLRLADLHVVALVCIMLKQAAQLATSP
jgi:transposase